jgi:hypothetical protein
VASGKLGERIAQGIGIVGGVVALTVALFQDRPASALALLALVLISSAAVLAYLWRARLPSGARKYTWQPRVATVSVAVIVVALSIVLVIPASREYALYDLIGLANPPRETAISGLVVGQNADSYRILASVSNASKIDQQLNQVWLDVYYNRNTKARCAARTYSYRLRDKVVLSGSGDRKDLEGSIEANQGGLEGYDLQIIGNYHAKCQEGRLLLSFNPNITLDKEATTELAIDIPKLLKAYSREVRRYDRPEKENGSFEGSLAIPVGPISAKGHETLTHPASLFVAKITVKIGNPGRTLSACHELSGPDVEDVSTSQHGLGCRVDGS